MPASKSVLREEKRPFAPVDTANRLFRKVLQISMKMPKRYTYLVLQEFLNHARGKPFHVWVNMIRYFDQLFNTEYKPPKIKCRRHRVLAYASLCATREV